MPSKSSGKDEEKRKRGGNGSRMKKKMDDQSMEAGDHLSTGSKPDQEERDDKNANLSKQNHHKHKVDEFESEFTFHPRVSSASARMVENLGMDFLARQERHLERQKKLYEDRQQFIINEQTPKRPKMNGEAGGKKDALLCRPCTSDRNLLKKRQKVAKNQIRRQSSVLEQMDTNTVLPPTPPSSSLPGLPPRAKTYYSTVGQSMNTSGIYSSGTMRKRSVNDPYSNFDRLQRAKMIAERAIKSKKIFSIHGPYPLIRRALRDRGWVEKEYKLPIKMKSNIKTGGDSSDVDDDDDDDYDDDGNQKDSGLGTSPRPPFESENDENEPDDCYGIMGRMVRNETAMFLWTTRTATIDWRFLQKDQIVNHFAKANFTTKVGLCMNLRTLNCFADANSDTFFPRCYRLSNEEDKLDFIDDFRLTAASCILKTVISRHVGDSFGQDSDKVANGQLPPPAGTHVVPVNILLLALKVCRRYCEEREHVDIDEDEMKRHIPDEDWDNLILHYSRLVHEGGMIAQSGTYFKQCEDTLSCVKDVNPQHFIEGLKNVWIVKPGAKSRGRGIVVMNKLEEILKLVSGDSTLMKDSRWVIQKYIERPLLIYGTKFDVRQWFLISDWNPVTVWIYKESYLRFSSKPFTLKNLDQSIHLCNYSVQKNFGIDTERSSLLPTNNMWSNTDFKQYLKERECHSLWDDKVFPGMKKAIIHICQTAQDTVEFRKGSFELYGADFMIDENYNPWLIEVNSSPTMSRSTSVTSRLCASVQEDTLKVILDRKKDKNCDIGLFELIYKQPPIDVPLYVGKALHVEGVTIKKPFVPIRRSTHNVAASILAANSPSPSNRPDSDVTALVSSKSVNRGMGVYSQIGSNRQVKVTIRMSGQRNQVVQAKDKSNSSRSVTAERSRSPTKMKMQSTIKKLSNEAQNTPGKPNVFNLPKQNQAVKNYTGNPVLPASTASVATQACIPKVTASSRIAVKPNVHCHVTNFPTNEDQSPSNVGGHFVSSSQAKAASTKGIMNIASSYNSIIASANRGYLPSKPPHHFPSPQVVIPKTFPASSLPGGDVIAGGNTLTHFGPPPGVFAVTPQVVGLGPFQRCFQISTDGPNNHSSGQSITQRRGVGVQDFRLGANHARVSDFTKSECVICGDLRSCSSSRSGSTPDMEFTKFRVSRYDKWKNKRMVTCNCASKRTIVDDNFLTNSVRCVGDPPPLAVRNEF